MLYAHCFFADHVVSTLYTVAFGVAWYIFDPHDGRRVANSEAQQDVRDRSSCVRRRRLDVRAR